MAPPSAPEPPVAITRSQLARQLRTLGVRAGGVAMVHARMSALGWVVGGSEAVVRALLDAVGDDGTVMAYAGWDDHVFSLDERPAGHRAAYAAEPPAFDVATAEAVRGHGRIPERIRTWPGARRSDHPEASAVAVGPRAGWLTAPHPADDAYGPGTPLARLVEADGQVLMLGAPLDAVTLLHHAEAIADVPGKRRIRSVVPVVGPDGRVERRAYADIDTAAGAFDYGRLGLADDPFAVIARAALAAGVGVRGPTGQAESHLFPAPALVRFAVAWLEARLR